MINIGFLVSYDFEYIFNALPLVYADADKIVLAIDKNRKTWSGNQIKIPVHFFERIKKLDSRRIIEFYEADFYVPELTAMECETRERTMLSKKLGSGWKIQLDSDEYIYDFHVLASFLRKYGILAYLGFVLPINFKGVLITLFRKTENGFLYIENNETFPFVTNKKIYTKARNTNNTVFINLTIKTIHQSWARDKKEIEDKVSNWGHINDFDGMEFINLWGSINETNCDKLTDFHPIAPQAWKKLNYFEAKDINEFLTKYKINNPQKTPFNLIDLLKGSIKINIIRIAYFLQIDKLYHLIKRKKVNTVK